MKKAFKKPELDAWFPSAHGEDPAPIKRVGVIGAGVMGTGIAHWLAARGVAVVLCDVDPAALERARGTIAKHFDQAIQRGKTSAMEARVASAAIQTATHWNGLGECDLIIEAIIENLAAKQALFAKLASLMPPTTILASNTSALPMDAICEHGVGGDRTIGIHFFNPVSRMPLIEVNLGSHTSRKTAERVLAWTSAIRKRAVICRSTPGFIVSRILFFYLNEAMRIWSTQPDTRAIDAAMLDFGMPMGPLRLIDEIGIDVTASIIDGMQGYFGGRFEPATIAVKLARAALKGCKSGAGFYHYSDTGEVVNPDAAMIASATFAGVTLSPVEIRQRLLSLMAREACGCIEEGVVQSAEDIDYAMRLGTGFPASRGGLTHWTSLLDSSF